MELVDVADSKSADGNIMWVRVPPPAPKQSTPTGCFLLCSGADENPPGEMRVNISFRFLLTTISFADIMNIPEADITETERKERLYAQSGTDRGGLLHFIILAGTTAWLRLAAGTLYGAINTLLEKGWITALTGEADSRKKEYIITETGREMLQKELQRLTELLENGKRLLGGSEQ